MLKGERGKGKKAQTNKRGGVVCVSCGAVCVCLEVSAGDVKWGCMLMRMEGCRWTCECGKADLTSWIPEFA